MARFSLQPLLDLMRERTDEATRKLGQLIATEQSARGQLQLLTEYREEYLANFRSAQDSGLTLQSWRNYEDFLERLDEAIRQQTEHVEFTAQNRAKGQAYWKEQNTRLKAIETLAIRHARAEEKKELKREQKQHDEISARKHSIGSTEGD
ncbi:MAG: flagellar export protein FliJ [Zoogloeaceae bacterium]|jgi:flagellar FliJ protein|nr:flagellar export protein FliJ [Zoogloeaceae bacterium]